MVLRFFYKWYRLSCSSKMVVFEKKTLKCSKLALLCNSMNLMKRISAKAFNRKKKSNNKKNYLLPIRCVYTDAVSFVNHIITVGSSQNKFTKWNTFPVLKLINEIVSKKLHIVRINSSTFLLLHLVIKWQII